VLAAAGLGEKGVPRAVVGILVAVGIYVAVKAEAVLETVAICGERISASRRSKI
jgi:hypothetical protein